MTESWTLRQWLDGNNGKRLWRGTMDVRNVLNQPVTTAFPIRETVKDWKPGAYFVVIWNDANKPAREGDDDDSGTGNAAGMWVMDTDIALTSFTGRDGLNVFARSLETAQPLPISRSRCCRAATSRSQGDHRRRRRVTFPAGMMRAAGLPRRRVMATDEGKQEFSRLELTKAAFDLSDRGIDGRDLPGRSTPSSIPSAASTGRRDGAADGHDARRFGDRAEGHAGDADRQASRRQRVHALHAGAGRLGALYQALPLPKSSRRGRWSVTTHIDPRRRRSAAVEFSVEDFVPEKLKVELQPDAPMLRTNRANSFNVQADFLYGPRRPG